MKVMRLIPLILEIFYQDGKTNFLQTRVRHNSKLEPSEFIFYEICPKDLDVSKYRFKYSYDTTQDIVRGLKQFYDCKVHNSSINLLRNKKK